MKKNTDKMTDEELDDLVTEELFAALGWIKPESKKQSRGEKKNSKKEKRIVQK